MFAVEVFAVHETLDPYPGTQNQVRFCGRGGDVVGVPKIVGECGGERGPRGKGCSVSVCANFSSDCSSGDPYMRASIMGCSSPVFVPYPVAESLVLMSVLGRRWSVSVGEGKCSKVWFSFTGHAGRQHTFVFLSAPLFQKFDEGYKFKIACSSREGGRWQN